MTVATAAAPAFRAAGATDPGLMRDANEDRFHVDVARGIFMVIDGVGGQAAGGEAAALALSMLRARLERETGPVDQRVREAIAVANNEIHRAAASRADWNGMACVLTVAVLEGRRGDGRARGRHAALQDPRTAASTKITRDHSPVGEREDAGELSESEAMRHPRRNEVYRDVGSELARPRRHRLRRHHRGARGARRGAAALQRRAERPGAGRHDCRGGGGSSPAIPSAWSTV